MQKTTKDKKHIKISDSYYPSDKDLFSFILGQKISKRRMKDFLIKKGIFCNFNNSSTYANLICDLILTDSDIQELLSFSNVREHRFKSTSIKLNDKNLTIDNIVSALNNEPFGKIANEFRIKLPSAQSPLSVDKEKGEITIKQPFLKVDYTKSTLFQETEHELILKFKEITPGSYEISIKSSAPEGEILIKNLKNKIYDSIKSASLYEIYLYDLTWENRNNFFETLLKDLKKEKLELESVEEIKLANPSEDKKIEDDETEEDSIDLDTDTDTDDDLNDDDDDVPKKKKDPIINSLTLKGESILELDEVKKWKDKGYYIRSVSGTYKRKKFSGSSNLIISIQAEFTKSGIFQVQTKKCQLEEEADMKLSAYNLDLAQKESIINDVNNTAFNIFDSLKQLKKEVKVETKAITSNPNKEDNLDTH